MAQKAEDAAQGGVRGVVALESVIAHLGLYLSRIGQERPKQALPAWKDVAS